MLVLNGFLCCLFVGIVFRRYDASFRSNHKLCLSILKRFGFGQRVMETRILLEVEEMINRVREQQGRAFDMKQLTSSCVANVTMSMLFGRRFDHSSLQHLISAVSEGNDDVSFALELCPALRFLPHFKKTLTKSLKTFEIIRDFITRNTAACMQVCSQDYTAKSSRSHKN